MLLYLKALYSDILIIQSKAITMFDWTGLKDKQYFILRQVPDPLKYCNYSIPIPLGIGLPFMPCDLPNQYTLCESDENFDHQGDIYLTFEQEVSLWHRVLIPASHRPWSIVGKDYYNHTPYVAFRDFNCCLMPNDRPQVRIYYKDKYIGKIIEKTIFNCCCWTQKFQSFEIYNARDEIVYRVESKNPQKGHFFILPCWGFDKIKYDIIKIDSIASQIDEIEDNVSDVYNLVKGQKVGEITHLWNSYAEYTSKNDKYGLKLPQNSSQEEKCLLIYCTLFIDYLLFQNF